MFLHLQRRCAGSQPAFHTQRPKSSKGSFWEDLGMRIQRLCLSRAFAEVCFPGTPHPTIPPHQQQGRGSVKSVLAVSMEPVAFFLSPQEEQGSTTDGLKYDNSGPTGLLTFDPRRNKLHTERPGAFFNSPNEFVIIAARWPTASSLGPRECCFMSRESPNSFLIKVISS